LRESDIVAYDKHIFNSAFGKASEPLIYNKIDLGFALEKRGRRGLLVMS
jgi:hypothetical protein